MNGLIIIGAGDQPKIIIDMFEKLGNKKIFGLIDVLNKEENIGKRILGCEIIDKIDNIYKYSGKDCVIAVGDPKSRQNIAQKLGSSMNFITLIHPTAYVSKHAKIGKGSMISVNAVINPNSVVGAHAIVNTSSTIDHDCNVGDFCNISPGVNVAGNVSIGSGTTIGIGAKIIDEIKVGSNCIIAAGAVVIDNVPDNSVVMGVPAKLVRHKK